MDTSGRLPEIERFDPLYNIPAYTEEVANMLPSAFIPKIYLLDTIDLNNIGLTINSSQPNGIWIQTNSANATLARNYPTTYAGMLETSASSSFTFIYQRYTTYSNSPAGMKMYIRSKYNATWAAWKEIA